MAKWENYGDVNPIEHGGFWIKKDVEIENCYYVVMLGHDYDSEEIVIFDGYVNISDDWIEWDSVESFVGGFRDDIDKVRGAFDYYGYQNFGGSVTKLATEKEAIEELERHGIKVD